MALPANRWGYSNYTATIAAWSCERKRAVLRPLKRNIPSHELDVNPSACQWHVQIHRIPHHVTTGSGIELTIGNGLLDFRGKRDFGFDQYFAGGVEFDIVMARCHRCNGKRDRMGEPVWLRSLERGNLQTKRRDPRREGNR